MISHKDNVRSPGKITRVSFLVPIVPFGKQRPRVAGGRAYTPKETKSYEAAFALHAKMAMKKSKTPVIVGGKIHISMVFSFPKNKINICGDIDNLCKSALDAMQGVVFNDDRYVWSIEATKAVGAEGSTYVDVEAIE